MVTCRLLMDCTRTRTHCVRAHTHCARTRTHCNEKQRNIPLCSRQSSFLLGNPSSGGACLSIPLLPLAVKSRILYLSTQSTPVQRLHCIGSICRIRRRCYRMLRQQRSLPHLSSRRRNRFYLWKLALAFLYHPVSSCREHPKYRWNWMCSQTCLFRRFRWSETSTCSNLG